ncbi:MAG TPA: hypothetical protein VNM67_02220 [Thermoanaerobaculia bacterium]|jgi:hypothetical protein|nr:hypothetical protein [Thermoanaerobaculia bacterium]
MRLKLGWVALGLVTATLIISCEATPEEKEPVPSAADVDALNSGPQKQYPELTLDAQKVAMQRIEDMRRRVRVERVREKIPPADWIAMAYHGLVLDANFDVIPMDPETVSKIQESMFSILQAPARERVTRKYGRDPGLLFHNQRLRGNDRLVIRTAVLQALLDESDEELQERYAWRHRLISRGANTQLNTQGIVLHPQVRELLRQFRLEDDLPAVPGSTPTYIESCRAEGVPIPPDWPDAKWISQGPLALVFVSAEYNAEVFAYKDPVVPGVCYALPRRDSAGSIQLLGIICQSATTGKACFWDNKTIDNVRLTGVDLVLDIDTIGNGMTLGENCTNCHRGDNAYTIHPGTALDLSRSAAVGGPYETDAAARFTPIAQPGWGNPGPLTLPALSTGQSSCVVCHGLPETRPDYCAAVLRVAALATMPPSGPNRAGWLPPAITNSRYTDHITGLSACP